MDLVALSFAIWIPSLPILIVCVVGIVLAARRLTLHRRALLCAQIGFSALILRTLVAIASQQIVMLNHASAATLTGRLVLVNAASYLLMLVGVLFLTMAVLADRSAPAREAPGA